VHIFYISTFFLLIGLNILDMQISTDYLAYAAGLLLTAFLLRTSFTKFAIIAISGMIVFTIGILRISSLTDNSVLLPMIVITLLSLYIQHYSESTRSRIFLLSMSLKETSIKDPLTKAYNRRFMMEALNGEIAKWERNQFPLSLLMLDIDYFKKINDDFSHSMGDQVLREISQVIFNNIRETDLFCRYGGEEFTIILTITDKDAAFIVAERIRQAIEFFPFSGITDRNITASLGIGIMQSGDDAESLIHRADENLYKSKRNGRNRTTC
jgi:diguanylate cyclase (GGDEF)-like protein